MDSADAGAYHTAEPDPVAAGAPPRSQHLNKDHADALLAMAAAGRPPGRDRGAPARGSTATGSTSRSRRRAAPETRLGFAEPANRPGDLRAATVELAKRSRAA